MPVDVPVTDVPEDSSPSATDHDFVSFVRSTLSVLNTKMDNLLSNQAAFEGSVPMFPGTYVPRYRCSPNLCSPVPMFPGTDVPRFLYFNSGH